MLQVRLISILALCALAVPASVPASTMTLTQDIDCTGGNVANCVTLQPGTKLQMNGHTIVGGGAGAGVNCLGSCRIEGPGTITGASFGVNAYGKLDLRGVDVVGNTTIGVQCFRACRATGPANLSNNGDGFDGSGITGTGTMKLRDVTVANNTTYGARSAYYPENRGKIDVIAGTFSGNGIGVSADRQVKLKDSSVTGNVVGGIEVGEANCTTTSPPILKNTVATGNGTDAGCGTTVACADVLSCKSPRLLPGSSCDRSYVVDSGIPGTDWDVCASD
jgi:hypothetical protein